jgi:Cu2+-exporting ATPase
VEEAQNRRAPVQQLVDRIAALFVPVVLVLAGITFCWQLAGGAAIAAALMTALAVVLIACPCALGLATPTAILAGSGVAAASGVIFKGGDVLERLARVTVVAFDKTGTLTRGEPLITEILPAPGISGDRLLDLAGAVEAGSTHPLARALVAEQVKSGGKGALAEDLRAVPGGGVTGVVAGMRVAVGSRRFLLGEGVTVPDDLQEPAPGETVVHVSEEGSYRGTVVLRDGVREGASDIVRYFQEGGVVCHLLSGDRKESARTIARQVGIENVQGDLLPADKGALIEGMQKNGAVVLMAGDGINDAPALATASVGCALAGGTDIAIETSDLVLAKGDLARLRLAHRVARRTMTVVRQNLWWAFIYNLVGIPLAMTGRLTPVYAAAAMALSSLCVVGNSLRLQRPDHG